MATYGMPAGYEGTLLTRATNSTNSTRHKTFFDRHHSIDDVNFTILTAIVLYNILELLILTFTTFRRFRSLYFISVLAATLGLFLYSLGSMISYYKFASQLSGLTLRALGWPAMITGQSFVLYSRLGVMFMGEYQSILKAMKWTIIVDALVNHTVTIILTFGNSYASPHRPWNRAFNIQHKFGRTCFTIQELVLSGLYIWRAVTFLRKSVILNNKKRMVLVMWQLIIINVIIEGLDIYVLYQEFLASHAVRRMVKAVVYGIKLKMEFAVLSQLVDITTESRSNYGSYAKNAHIQSVPEEEMVLQPTTARSRDTEIEMGRKPTIAGYGANPLGSHPVR